MFTNPLVHKIFSLSMQSPMPIQEIVETARELGRQGDYRVGVNLTRNGLPDIAWCRIPSGIFRMGGDPQVSPMWERTSPFLDRYYIARYPVTNVQFDAFIKAEDGYANSVWWEALAHDYQAGPYPITDEQFSIPNVPRVMINWFEAVAFTRWLSAKLGYEIRLATEQEWAKAARGSHGYLFAYGNHPNLEYGQTSEHGLKAPAPVGVFLKGASPYGVMDMTGNVWEWCQSHWRVDLTQLENNLVDSEARRCLRGGAWDYDIRFARATYRNWNMPWVRAWNYGFRLVTLSRVEK